MPSKGNPGGVRRGVGQRMNERKNAAMGDRQRALAQKLCEARLLSKKGLKVAQGSK